MAYNDNTTKLKAVIFFVLTFTCGVAFFYSYMSNQFTFRDPAAIRGKIHQIKSLDPDELKSEISKNLQIQPVSTTEKHIRFTGFSSNICKQYEDIEIQFFAEGISVAGEPPTFSISAPCLPAQDPVDLASIEIPIAELMKQKPGNLSIKFDQYKSTFSFKNAADSWPQTWVLKTVLFSNKNGNTKKVSFDSQWAAGEQPIVLEF